MSQTTLELTAENGETIRGVYQEPYASAGEFPCPTLMIFCHGFPNSHMGAHQKLFERLQNVCALVGMHSVRFDFRGCGKSDGASEGFTLQQALEDLELVFQWGRAHKFERFMLTAEGLGSVPAVMGLQEGVKSLSLFWPVFDPQDYMRRNFEIPAHVWDQEEDEEGYIIQQDIPVSLKLLRELDGLDFLPALQGVIMPCLIQHGASDEKVPVEQLEIAKEHFSNRRIELTTYQNGRHGLPEKNQQQYMLYHYQQFIAKYV